MTRLAYAIARSRSDLPLPAGTARLVWEDLAIIHGPSPVDLLTPGLATLEGFASIVAALHAKETVLPLRFGSRHESESELEAVLRVRPDEWRGLLDDVEGCEEMGLRVLLEAPEAGSVEAVIPAAPSAHPGLAYMAGRRAELAVKDAWLAEANRVEPLILGAFEGLYRRIVVEPPAPGRDRLLSFAFLVPRADLDAFREVSRTLSDRGFGKVLSTGPWPPYHFASPTA